MTAEHNGADALMAAITDDPLTDEARADAAFMAEHRSATADVALLREQLEVIGRALTEPAKPKVPEPVPVRPRRRRPFALALSAVGVAAAGAMVVGMGWLLVQAGGGSADDAGATSADSAQSESKDADPLGSPAYLACARLVAEGDVTDVQPVPGERQERITLDVTRSYKPAKGEDEVTFVIRASAGLDEGDHLLVAIPRGSASPDFWFVGERDIAPQRQALIWALPESRTTACE
ncbi:hypothetical protein [Streptomyces sp. NPDC127197]|uniref:hypothetical protein n=1 Tax=Streptomyces sp. NPDC127197 TaxID=3345388 RepID=UPI003634179C